MYAPVCVDVCFVYVLRMCYVSMIYVILCVYWMCYVSMIYVYYVYCAPYLTCTLNITTFPSHAIELQLIQDALLCKANFMCVMCVSSLLWCVVVVYGVWFMVYCGWCMVYGVWCMAYGVWCMVYGVWCMVYGVGVRCMCVMMQEEGCESPWRCCV